MIKGLENIIPKVYRDYVKTYYDIFQFYVILQNSNYMRVYDILIDKTKEISRPNRSGLEYRLQLYRVDELNFVNKDNAIYVILRIDYATYANPIVVFLDITDSIENMKRKITDRMFEMKDLNKFNLRSISFWTCDYNGDLPYGKLEIDYNYDEQDIHSIFEFTPLIIIVEIRT
jgi:hypothetical protein